MVIYMYIVQGQTTPWEHFFCQKHKFSIKLVIYCKFFPINDFIKVFPIQTHIRPNLTLRLNRSRSGLGHHLYKFCRAWVPSATCQVSRSQDFKFFRRRFLKVFTIYGHGGHLGHVTWIIYTNFRSPFPRRLHIKFGFDWPSGFSGEDVWKWWSYTSI